VDQAGVVRTAKQGCLVYRPHRSEYRPPRLLREVRGRAAFDVHRKAPHLAADRQRRKKEGPAAGLIDLEIYRSLTE